MATRKLKRGKAEPDAGASEGAPAVEDEGLEVLVDIAEEAPRERSGPERSRAPTASIPARGVIVAEGRAGRYVLSRELASGGMATVYLARFEGAAGFSRPVALKRIHMHLSRDPHFVDMFLDEARISARLTHANVCAVHDFGQDENGGYYLAMEYLAGEPLAAVVRAALRRDPRAPADARYRRFVAYLLTEAAAGLHAAHEAHGPEGEPLEIVHRDVTPNNLFVTFDGHVKVVDFGIAKARDRVTQTGTGELKGSLPYVSPEHARGREADRRADVWSLGVVAWEMTTGKRLFKRQMAADTLYAVLGDEVPRVTELEPSVPPAWADAIARALQREPGERWPTAKAFAEALAAAAEADGPRASPAEIAAWLDELFPGARLERQRLVGEALRAPEATPTPAPKAVSIAASPPRSRGWLAAPLALVVIALVSGGALLVMRESAAAPASSSAPPPPSTVPAAPPRASVAEPAPAPPPSSAAPAPATEIEASAPPPTSRARHDRPRATTTHEEAAPVPSVAATRPPPSSRAPAPTTSAATPGEGTVVIVVPDGWGDVYDGARRLGATPLRTTLPAGPHDLEVRIEGHAPGRAVHADVRAGETTRLVVHAAS